MKILVLHGPNLNLLGQRDPELYGRASLTELNEQLAEHAQRLGIEVDFFQSNTEGVLIDQVQKAAPRYAGIVFNPGGFAHTSVALRDAIEASPTPVIEVHLSNVHARESFRRRSLLAPVCRGQIAGLGAESYAAALWVFSRGQAG